MKAFFIKSTSGQVFTLYHTPEGNAPPKRNILFVPPFAEELNRSRHMINRQARAFVKAGYGVLILDLFGTGDSEGTFGAATISLWQQDILAALSWLNDRSDQPPILWAMRSGALITADLIQKNPDLTDQLILWSPVTNGKKFITQYLRIKLAAEVTNKAGGAKTTIKDLWAILDAGESLEIAGYEISPELAKAFTELALNSIKLPAGLSVKWIEICLGETIKPSPASQKVIDGWRHDSIAITTEVVNDISFWTLQHPEGTDIYINKTLSLLQNDIA